MVISHALAAAQEEEKMWELCDALLCRRAPPHYSSGEKRGEEEREERERTRVRLLWWILNTTVGCCARGIRVKGTRESASNMKCIKRANNNKKVGAISVRLLTFKERVRWIGASNLFSSSLEMVSHSTMLPIWNWRKKGGYDYIVRDFEGILCFGTGARRPD